MSLDPTGTLPLDPAEGLHAEDMVLWSPFAWFLH